MSDKDVAELAKVAWRTDDDDGPPSEVWWDSREDAWLHGFETGYKAALGRTTEGADEHGN